METSLKNIMLSLQEELTCALCRDIYVQPKALIPCLHTFCSECIYGLEAVDPLRCPICRSTSFNTLNNFTVQSFLDIFEKSKLTVESLSSCSISSSSSSYISVPHSPASSSSTAITCRSCPCNSNELNYVCSEGDRHIRCSFCSDYMPARNFKKDGPALDQCCNFCGIIACDAYWGCRNTDKESKLYILSEARDIESLVLDISSIDHIENGHLNKSEISLLNQFIRRGCLTWTEAWKHCLVDFDDNNYRTCKYVILYWI
ncbi:hypothetical protein BDB01DRAFT_801704 [Pilobolus umbonatus]|nr:hypothetical protein BDB01DRAFT_801704 [Pilobolus umbonatus]